MKKKIVVNGEETNYSITDDARLFNDLTGRELKGTYSTNEYHSVQLVINGKPKTFMFHRLVAEAFCENPNNYTIVDHIDQDKHNDHATNLRWVGASANAKNISQKVYRPRIAYTGDFTEKPWRQVYGHPNYMVSDEGEFVTLKSNTFLLLQNRNGYLRVQLDAVYYSAHVIVWESFNEQQVPEGYQIDHIDGNRQNNLLSNLRLVDHSSNMKNSFMNGHKGQVAVKQYSLDGKYLKTYSSIRAAAQENNILEAGLKDATNRHGTSGGYYWLRENDNVSIEEVLYGWVPEGFTIIPQLPTYCINKDGQVYNKRNKKFTPIHYCADGITAFITVKSRRYYIKDLMP